MKNTQERLDYLKANKGDSIRVSNRFEEPTVTAVKETYENVYCTLNDFKVQFPKCTKDVKGFYRFIKSNYEMNQKARVTK